MFVFSTRRIKLLLLLPAIVFFCVYVVYPIGYSFLIAFQDKPTYKPGRFVGLANFAEMLTDERLLTALKNTAIIVSLEMLMIPVLSFLMGMFFSLNFRGNTIVKILGFTPNILSGIITTLVWFFIVDPRIGLINSLLNALHVDTSSLLLIGGPTLTPYTVAVIETWKSLGGYAILFMAAIKQIPTELYDAAGIDGASAVQKVWFITLPMLRETNKIVAVYVFLNSIQSLQTVIILTGGQPNFKSNTIASYLYEVFAKEGRAGYASSLALLMFIVMMGISIIFLRLNARRVEE